MEVRRTMDVCEKEDGEEDNAKKRSEHLKGKVGLQITKMIRVLEATKPSDLVSAQLNAFCFLQFSHDCDYQRESNVYHRAWRLFFLQARLVSSKTSVKGYFCRGHTRCH